MSTADLERSTQFCRLLSDSTRLRLMLLLEQERLTVAELTQILELSQSRVSSHLSKLREAGMLDDERIGSRVFNTLNRDHLSDDLKSLWEALSAQIDDAQINHDLERASQIIATRESGKGWASSVAGRMERHYSPGRTWESTARALISLLTLGKVLDIGSGDGVLAEILAAQAESVHCLDVSEAVIAAARKRLKKYNNVEFSTGDMHDLQFADNHFNQVFLMNVLSYSQTPEVVISEAARVLAPDGQLILNTLKMHDHRASVDSFDHQNLGFSLTELDAMIKKNRLLIETKSVNRETRPPYFEVITLSAKKQQ